MFGGIKFVIVYQYLIGSLDIIAMDCNLIVMIDITKNQQELITDQTQLLTVLQGIEARCFKLDNFQQIDISIQEMIDKLQLLVHSIKELQLFSPNESLKEVHTEKMKFLALPYHLGWLYGRLREPRRKAVETSKVYLSSFLKLMQQFNCEEEEVFPQVLAKMWKQQEQIPSYRPPRDELIKAVKQKKLIEQRYSNSQKIKEASDQRQSIRDYLTLRIHQSISLLRTIEEELQILAYKQSIQKDPQTRQKYEEELNKPLPKIKVWQIPAKDQIHQCMCPTMKKKDLVAQVWQQNANKPTMTLEEVGELQYQNMMERTKRQKAQAEANKVDTDSDKEEVDDRQKKKARAWDDWKDQHEKGAGNKGNR